MKRLEQIEPLTDKMLGDLACLVRYDSRQTQAQPGMPFGPGPAGALDEALKIAREMGFRTENMENYCGYAEMGQGEDIIGIVAHLDIVPAGEGWDTDPFTLTRKGDTVYGRGVTDDKGAVIASLYAMDLVRRSGVPLGKRVRLLMGCNEESGAECMHYYASHGEKITAGFTPDGYFPGIFGEKGGCGMVVESKHTKILSMNGGFVSNAVCDHAVTVLSAADVDEDRLRAALEATPLKAFTLTRSGDELTVDAQGCAAHASTPHLGVNAAAYTMAALQSAGMQDDFVDFYMEKVGTACDGAGIGLNISDKYGALTLNNGIVKTENGTITCTIDIRYPVTYTPADIRRLTEGRLENEKGAIRILRVGEPLFCDPESDLVRKLYAAYREVTGDETLKPMVIGGGTYAKSVPGIIAFGCEFPDVDSHIHDKNESLTIPDLHRQVDIYTQAILNLLED